MHKMMKSGGSFLIRRNLHSIMNAEDTPQVRRVVKNTVFLDLFSLPEYQLQMVQTLHPEMTDLTEADIKTLTLNPVILNGQYNDLALLVRDT